MRRFTIFILFFLCALCIKAQRIIDLTYCPNVQEFVNNAGPFLFKDVYVVGDNKISLNVVILTDTRSGNKIGYVDYTSQNVGQNTGKVITAILVGYAENLSYFTSSLDADEIPYCISCLEYAKENLMNKPTDGDISYYFYDTKLGGRIGVKGKKTNWEAFFNADPLARDEFERTISLESKKIDKIIEAFHQAQNIIAEKTK